MDYRRRFALVATDPRTGLGIAVARYEATGDDVADVAVAVDPAWHGLGLATALVETLAEIALDRGIHTSPRCVPARSGGHGRTPLPVRAAVVGGPKALKEQA